MKKTSDDFRKSSYAALRLILPLLLLISGGLEGIVFAASPVDEKTGQPTSYHYNLAAKSDPFHSFVEKDLSLKKKIEKANITSIFPLQRAGIDQFNLVGIAGDVKYRLAILEIKDAKVRFYIVVVGTVIGLNNGKVVEIKSDMIVIEEVTKGRTGQKINRITKKLHTTEEEGTP